MDNEYIQAERLKSRLLGLEDGFRAAMHDEMLEAIKAASHALRSYQYGNSSEELAKEMADALDGIVAKAEGGEINGKRF